MLCCRKHSGCCAKYSGMAQTACGSGPWTPPWRTPLLSTLPVQTRWATLVFQPRAAQWVRREQWHPRQRGAWRDDGCYVLEVPYADETELLMDVPRHGDQVEVIQPGALREAVQRRFAAALATYAAGACAPEPLGSAGDAGRK
jgi:hypothetical protein